MSTIAEALKGINYPVVHPPYLGEDKTYVTYQIIGQNAILYGESREQETTVSYSVDIWTDEPFLGLLLLVKERLENAGYIVTIDMETYDNATKRWHVAMTAVIEGAVYG